MYSYCLPSFDLTLLKCSSIQLIQTRYGKSRPLKCEVDEAFPLSMCSNSCFLFKSYMTQNGNVQAFGKALHSHFRLSFNYLPLFILFITSKYENPGGKTLWYTHYKHTYVIILRLMDWKDLEHVMSFTH